MCKIKPTVFSISEDEIRDIADEMINEKILKNNLKLSREQIIEILAYVECDEFLAKDIHMSIRGAIVDVVNG
jgi:hypothetical protein